MSNAQYCVVAIGPRGGLVSGCFYYPRTDEGLKKAKAKRVELMAKYLQAEVEIYEDDF